MKPDREQLVFSPTAPTFEKTLAGLFDDFYQTVALARAVHLLNRRMNTLANTDGADENTAMAEMLDRNIKLLSEVAELAGQPIDADKLRHLATAQIQAPDDTDLSPLSLEQISTAVN